MSTFSLKSSVALTACSGLLLLAGCNHDRDREYNEAPQSSSGQYSAPAPAMAAAPQQEVKDDHGVKFAVLAQGSLITPNLDQWHALNPEFFKKLTGITVPPAVEVAPRAGFGYVIPHIEANPEHPDQKIGRLTAGYLVPKELHNWVAIDQKTFSELIKKFMAQ